MICARTWSRTASALSKGAERLRRLELGPSQAADRKCRTLSLIKVKCRSRDGSGRAVLTQQAVGHGRATPEHGCCRFSFSRLGLEHRRWRRQSLLRAGVFFLCGEGRTVPKGLMSVRRMDDDPGGSGGPSLPGFRWSPFRVGDPHPNGTALATLVIADVQTSA